MGQDVQLVLAYIAAIVIHWRNFENRSAKDNVSKE